MPITQPWATRRNKAERKQATREAGGTSRYYQRILGQEILKAHLRARRGDHLAVTVSGPFFLRLRAGDYDLNARGSFRLRVERYSGEQRKNTVIERSTVRQW